MKETDPRFFWLEKKVMLFLLSAAIGLAAITVFIGIERGVFISKYRIYFTVARGTGLFESMPVKLSGFKIGKIESLELTDDAKVKVTLSINEKYHKWIRRDSMALRGKEGLIGESIIDITLGSMGEPIIENDAEIRFHRTRELEDIAEDMLPVLVEIKEIIDYINNPQGDFKQILSHANQLTEDLHATKDDLNKLLQAAQGRIANLEMNSAKTFKSIEALSGNVDKTVTQVGGRLPAVMDKLDRSLDNIEKASSRLKSTLDTSAPAVPALLSKGGNLLDDTQQVMTSLKQTWPIRSNIQESDGRLLRGDSHE